MRSYILSPDRERLLNEQAGVMGMAMTEIGDEYVKMLRASLECYRKQAPPSKEN